MKVSTRGDYASRALLSLALHGDGQTPRSVREVADITGLPQPYLEQILLALKGAGLVRSKRGVGGGYVLAREPNTILLSQIVAAVDGPIVAGDFADPDVFANPVVLSIAGALLGGDFILGSYVAVTSMPGAKAQRLHADQEGLFGMEALCFCTGH